MWWMQWERAGEMREELELLRRGKSRMGDAREMLGMGFGIRQPLGGRAPNAGLLHTISQLWQASRDKTSLLPKGH